MKYRSLALALALALATPALSLAQSKTEDHSAHHPSGTSAPFVNAEVRRVDKAAGKVTLRHEAIPNLDMPGMTMVFTAQKPEVLDSLKVGDKVRFTADKVNGQYIATSIESAQ